MNRSRMNQATRNPSRAPRWAERWKDQCRVMGLLWHECGQDFALFCYRIGYSAVTVMHSRALELAPVSLGLAKISTRKTHACSNPSSIFSAHSTILKD
jgi:hypothetical protein